MHLVTVDLDASLVASLRGFADTDKARAHGPSPILSVLFRVLCVWSKKRRWVSSWSAVFLEL